jgi:DNA-binding GntR family transcriptional regulator
MTRLVRTNTSEAVAAYILGQLFDGSLRSGDRIDLDEVAGALGVSRVPVREALIQLERDGLVDRAHYRRAFVAEFDAATVFEAFELYGMLSALTNRRVAARRDAGVLESLGKLDEALTECADVEQYEQLAREFRRVVNLAAAGNHLRALLRSFGGLVPAAARFSIVDSLADERAALHAEYEALCAGDTDAAGAAALDHIRMTAGNAVRALRRRGIFAAESATPPSWSDVEAILRTKDGVDR